ncbi:hypothetical protein PR202_ga11722 [Eleusine coracana subsp. coracana]|uniref:Bifunctional inhibitor/plant lipid transfer protein/seed storage helical domain-containing protein n=1 Tax=Eleusine coracana subsp. coracana TaxID=191504 RepID=A0AAV5CA94_ELECO|nr:hypothetical protein PR202_ga11722 [Eleusine coracana subsp. coracana]
MKQITFLLALAVALSAIGAATAQFEDLRREGAHEAMEACKAYLMKQCTESTMPITWPWEWRMGSCRALKQRCCNQLEQVPPTCRCKAIRSTVQEIMQGSKQQGGGHQMTMISKVKQVAKTLPSICNMYPSYCNIPPTNEACYC